MNRLRSLILVSAAGVVAVAGCGSDEKKGEVGTVESTAGVPGAGGGQLFASGGANSGGVPACIEVGAPCEDSKQCCGTTSICNKTAQVPEWTGCHVACTADLECGAGECCFKYQSVDAGFCAALRWCACGKAGDPCGGGQPECCDDQGCAAADTAGAFKCAPRCTTDAECPGGCCLPAPNTGGNTCFPALFCPQQ